MNEKAYTILIVDDEPIARMSLAALLDRSNYHIEMAEDGVKGLELVKQINPDVILLDVMMPTLNGYEVCKRIRSDPQIAEVPIILITALDDREAKLDGLAAGADDFLSKPFDSLEPEIRLHTLKRVNRYRHLVEEREKLSKTLVELSAKNLQLSLLSRQILEAQENERRYVAVELHDEIGQLVTGLKLILERPQQDTAQQLGEAMNVSNELLQRLREMSLNLRPTALDDLGLFAALDGLFKRFSKQTNIVVRHNINPLHDRRFDRIIETTIFRITQEALTNAARHSGASEVRISLILNPTHLWLEIEDTGKGFKLEEMDMGVSTGLSGMSERVGLAGGNFKIQSAPGEGTLILVDFEVK